MQLENKFRPSFQIMTKKPNKTKQKTKENKTKTKNIKTKQNKTKKTSTDSVNCLVSK